MNSKNQKVQRKGRPTLKQKPTVRPLARLLAAIKDFKYILSILKSMKGFRLAPTLDASINRLTDFCLAEAKKVAAGNRSDDCKVERITAMALGVSNDLYNRFEAFLSGTFDHFDNVTQSLRAIAPEVLDRGADQIAKLQEDLRFNLDVANDASYEDIAASYTAVIDFLAGLQLEAQQVVAEQTQKEDEGFADDLLKELKVA